MNPKSYIIDKKIDIFITSFLVVVVAWLLVIFNVNAAVTVLITGLMVVVELLRFILDYRRRSAFYITLFENVKRLDQSYLVLETLDRPEFLEGQLLYDVLYDIDKSMIENVNTYSLKNKEFREYIELWIHEVKLPLSSISLKLHNLIESDSKRKAVSVNEGIDNQNNDIEIYKKLQSEIRRIESYVDQVLYYSRSENAEKDYHIAEITFSRIIHDVAMDNREALLENGIDLRIEDIADITLNTDQKWFSFILGQLISNSIKYKRDVSEPYIRIYAKTEGDIVKVSVEDNGIGIPESDLKRVFEKSFTGTNGLGRAKSTGMGLYIAKTLCDKLGHRISIESEQGEWTRVTIVVKKNEFFGVINVTNL